MQESYDNKHVYISKFMCVCMYEVEIFGTQTVRHLYAYVFVYFNAYQLLKLLLLFLMIRFLKGSNGAKGEYSRKEVEDRIYQAKNGCSELQFFGFRFILFRYLGHKYHRGCQHKTECGRVKQ